MNCSVRRPCFIDHFFLTSDFCQVPRRNFLQFFPFLVHCCFCCRNVHSLRHRISLTAGEEHEDEEDDEKWLSWLWVSFSWWKSRGRTWQTWYHHRNEVFRVVYYPNPVFNEVCFLTIDPFVGMPIFIAKLSKQQYCWRVFEDFHGQEYIQFFDTHNCLFMRLHFSIGDCDCRTTARFRQSIQFSITQVFFLLIMCIDAPESTTNSRSSGLRVDAGRHQFSKGEKNVALSCSFDWNAFLVYLHAASGAPCSCHSISSWDRSSNFGALGPRSWSSLGQIFPSEGFWCWIFGVTRNGLCEFHTLDWLPHVLCPSREQTSAASVLKYATQLLCIRRLTFRHFLSQFLITSLPKFPRSIMTFIGDRSFFLPITLLQQSHSTFAIILFGPFCRLFINLLMCEWALFPKATTTLGLVEQAFSLILLHERIRRRFWWCNFSTLVNIVAETGIVSHTARWFPIANNLQEFFVHAVLYSDSRLLKNSIPDPKILVSNFLLDASCHQRFNLWQSS